MVPMHFVSQEKIKGPERTDPCVFVMKAIEVRRRDYSMKIQSKFSIKLNITFSGNGVTGCVPGDCISLRHEMCPNDRACYDSTCVGLYLIVGLLKKH